MTIALFAAADRVFETLVLESIVQVLAMKGMGNKETQHFSRVG